MCSYRIILWIFSNNNKYHSYYITYSSFKHGFKLADISWRCLSFFATCKDIQLSWVILELVQLPQLYILLLESFSSLSLSASLTCSSDNFLPSACSSQSSLLVSASIIETYAGDLLSIVNLSAPFHCCASLIHTNNILL